MFYLEMNLCRILNAQPHSLTNEILARLNFFPLLQEIRKLLKRFKLVKVKSNFFYYPKNFHLFTNIFKFL